MVPGTVSSPPALHIHIHLVAAPACPAFGGRGHGQDSISKKACTCDICFQMIKHSKANPSLHLPDWVLLFVKDALILSISFLTWRSTSSTLPLAHCRGENCLVRLFGQVMNWQCLNWLKAVQIGKLPCKRGERNSCLKPHGLNFLIPAGAWGIAWGPPLGVLKRKNLKRKLVDQVRVHATCFGMTRKDEELD